VARPIGPLGGENQPQYRTKSPRKFPKLFFLKVEVYFCQISLRTDRRFADHAAIPSVAVVCDGAPETSRRAV